MSKTESATADDTLSAYVFTGAVTANKDNAKTECIVSRLNLDLLDIITSL
jgi:hypothetical protein